MADFDGFIGAKVLTPRVWNVVNSKSPRAGNIFTASVKMVYSPGFALRDINQVNLAAYEQGDDGLYKMVSGPDDDTNVYVAVVPETTDLTSLDAIQPYLDTSRYSLAATVVRVVNGLIIPAGFNVVAYTPKPDLTVNIFGVEGRASPFKATSV